LLQIEQKSCRRKKLKLIVKQYCSILVCLLFFVQSKGQLLSASHVNEPHPAGDTLQGLLNDTTKQQTHFIINGIYISGNQKTKHYIIERELTFKPGDSVYLPELVSAFQRSKELLINTRLFNDVVISLKSFQGYLVNVQIDVKERWYIFPIPYFKPVDRNLSAWADKNYSLSRINYGLKFTHNNFTGRNDKLRLWLITGYTRQIQLNYDQPYADKSLKHGFGASLLYLTLKEVNSSTVNNQQQFIKADTIPYAGKYLAEQFNFQLSYYYRPAIKTRHTVRMGIAYSYIDSAVTVKNPDYFSNNKRRLTYPEFSYTLEYQNVDYVPYVLRGFMGDFSFAKRGINADMNLWQLSGRFTKAWPVGIRSSYMLQGGGVLKLPFDQPFFNQRLFGYGDFYLRGLERYVVDGVAGLIVRNTVRRKIFQFNIPVSHIPTLDQIPVSIYVKLYGDAGYVRNKYFTQNSLVNTMLYTGGAGIDFVTAYDFVFRCEFSFNQLGQPGFFFHIRNEF
jgi:hypothetical protein